MSKTLAFEPIRHDDLQVVQTPCRTEQVIADLSRRLAAVPDAAFLTEYASAAGRALGADYFIISRLNPYSNLMRTVRFLVNGKEEPNIVYSLDGTPCENAIKGGCCIFSDEVADRFPHDQFLKDYDISGYAGTALMNSRGEALGVVLSLTRNPIADEDIARAVLEHFATRVAAAMETAEIMDRNSWAIAEATDGVWDWDVLTGGTTISQSIQDMLGYKKGRGPYDLTQIESAIHADERALHHEALQDHLKNGTPFDINIRFQDTTGAYRWFRSRGKAMRNEQGRPVRMIGSFTDIDRLVTTGG